MNTAVERQAASQQAAEHIDILIVGAGISGIDAAYHVRKHLPNRSIALLETQDTFGGTWNTHKYPGIRSDSDLYTFGFKWKPWVDAPIATSDKIIRYLDEALDENDLRQYIRYQHKVIKSSWSSEDKLWTVVVEDLSSGETKHFTTDFLWMCQGYYKHEEPYTPQWPGMDQYQGRIVHPQQWPEDLDYSDMNVLVIGSGATAATLVPAMAGKCKHITMLQRSPTYFAPNPNSNELADTLRTLDIPEEWTHEIVRKKILLDQEEITRRSFEEPEALKAELLDAAREFLGPDFDIDKHFTPKYRPWQQRLAFIPDGDLFTGIAQGLATVVTDEIETFTKDGLRTKSGEELKADLIVTATGFNLLVLGGIEFDVDGKPVDLADTVTYRGMMFTGVPNLAWVFGYFRASWTLRADLISELLMRMFTHMDAIGATVVTPELRPQDSNMQIKPWIDADNFNPGYLTRGLHLMPKQGDVEPWVFSQDYWSEKDIFPAADLEDGALRYT
ncbi:MAG: NAD(P)/FAD-dependent oxidoreductase [Pseudomonadaceae bacterium]|nr:NAD(P)/FAD-dependent oxidoreductase [Pseudomonadaceae bacterium]